MLCLYSCAFPSVNKKNIFVIFFVLFAISRLCSGSILNSPRVLRAYADSSSNFDGFSSSTCSYIKCAEYGAEFSYEEVQANCSTTICYTVYNNASTLEGTVREVDVLGLEYNPREMRSNTSLWKHYSCGTLQNVGQIGAFKSRKFCFNLPRKHQFRTGLIRLHMDVASCVYNVPVPYISYPCSPSCRLDPNTKQGTCGPCKLKPGQPPNDYCNSGYKLCTLKVLNVINNKIPCISTSTVSCVLPSSEDCVLGGPYYAPCTANCYSKTVTMTGIYTTARPAAGLGKECKVPAPTYSVCSLPTALADSECYKGCVIDWRPENPCNRYFENNPAAEPTWFWAPSETTLQIAEPLEPPCPRARVSCDCRDCVLGPTPTWYGACDAICTKNLGFYAFGKQEFEYSVSKNANNGGNCASRGTRQCSKLCQFTPTRTECDNKCTITSTMKNYMPWVYVGYKKIFQYSKADFQVTTAQCSSVMDKSPCFTSVHCHIPDCPCRKTGYNGPKTWKSATCTREYIDDDENQCDEPRTFSYRLPSDRCQLCKPGRDCDCDCKFTTSSYCPGENVMQYSGFKTCHCAPVRGSDDDCQDIIISHTTSSCTVTYTETESSCIYQIDSCRPCFWDSNDCKKNKNCPRKALKDNAPKIIHKYEQDDNSTDDSEDDQTEENDKKYSKNKKIAEANSPTRVHELERRNKVGEKDFIRICTATDFRHGSDSSFASCTPKVYERMCDNLPTPKDCSMTTVCPECRPKCTEQYAHLTTSIRTCTEYRVRMGFDGGLNDCPPSKTFTSACTATCTSLPPPPDHCEKSIFVFEDVYLVDSVLEGAAVIGGNATFLDVKIDAFSFINIELGCRSECNVLNVGGNLVFSGGEILRGHAFVQGSCTNNISAKCGITCKTDCYCSHLRVNIEKVRSSVIRESERLAKLSSTTVTKELSGALDISWSYEENQITAVSSGISRVAAHGPLPQLTALFVFNVAGVNVNFVNFKSTLPSAISAKVIWNFFEAKNLDLTQAELTSGIILAPYAKITGKTVFSGEVYCRSLKGTYGSSLTVRVTKYTGRVIFSDAALWYF